MTDALKIMARGACDPKQCKYPNCLEEGQTLSCAIIQDVMKRALAALKDAGLRIVPVTIPNPTCPLIDKVLELVDALHVESFAGEDATDEIRALLERLRLDNANLRMGCDHFAELAKEARAMFLAAGGTDA